MFPLLADGLPEPLQGRDPPSLVVLPLSTNLSTSLTHTLAPGGVEGGGNWTELWLARLFVNLAGYTTVLLPGYLFILYTRRTGYLDRAGSGWWGCLVRACIAGSGPSPSLEEGGGGAPSRNRPPTLPLGRQCLSLAYCTLGLLGSYLVWGLLQERVMAYEYGGADGAPEGWVGGGDDSRGRTGGERFGNSQFIVFTNRVLALGVALLVLAVRELRARLAGNGSGGEHCAPLYKYAYSSVSNILSSWCQYEALKFVSFPVQVLAKASKVIPVMLMGRVVSRRSYSWGEYGTAGLTSLGLFLFLLTSGGGGGGAAGEATRVTTLSGTLILAGYLAFDSFTSNWQGELFRTYYMSSIQMMAGINFFSVLLTSVSLLQQGAFSEAAQFAQAHPVFGVHVLVLSLTSALGQLFIFHTIARHGAVTFTLIMTVRQAVAVLLSALVYSHPIPLLGAAGVALVFIALLLRAWPARGGVGGASKGRGGVAGLRGSMVGGRGRGK